MHRGPVKEPRRITKHRIERRYCSDCKRIVENEVKGVLPRARLGPRLMVMVTWLKIGLRMTEEAIPRVMRASFGTRTSEGEVISILSQVARAFATRLPETWTKRLGGSMAKTLTYGRS